MINNYLVSFADIESSETWIKKFTGRSFEEIQDKIIYCDEAEFFDEQPTSINIMYKQRLRWEKGFRVWSRPMKFCLWEF